MLEVVDNADALQYEARADGEPIGVVRYTRDGDVVTMVHTEVDPKAEGGGIGGELVRQALDDVRARGLRVRPVCPFVAAFVRRHPEYGDLVLQD